MRDYLQTDLNMYCDPRAVMELQKAHYSQKADKYMQTIFYTLIQRVKTREEELNELREQLENLESALQRQQRHVVQQNDQEASPERTREERVHDLSEKGYSQREIAEEVGLSRPRVQQILKAGYPLSSDHDSAWSEAIKNGEVSLDDRNLKICEWRDLGHSQKEISNRTGLSVSRVSEIISTRCTQVQNSEPISQKAQKNGFHRNTQARIEKIRKVAPKLARKCEQREIKVSEAMRQCRGELERLNLI
mgnify:CR=1 FL=1